MPSFRTGTVTALLEERPGIQRVEVDGEPSYNLVELTGPVALGDRVVVNTTAVERGLGTGGWHVVHWNLAREEWSAPGPGHVMKLRYTSLQVDTGVAEEHLPATAGDLDGLPVVVVGLHSQLPLVVAGARWRRPGVRIAYVMTDGGALPLALSDLVHGLREEGRLVATITAGHAFGGDLEAVGIPSALWLARHRTEADLAVVGVGPGIVGTGTRLGTSAVDQVHALEMAAALGGRPVATVRWSEAESRARHRGLSHHTVAVLALTGRSALLPIPEQPVIDADTTETVLAASGHHRVVAVPCPTAAEVGVEVTTMGRSLAEEPRFAAFSLAAGVAAADLVDPARFSGRAPAGPAAPADR